MSNLNNEKNLTTDDRETLHNKYFIKYEGTWTTFKQEVYKFLSETYFNLNNLNQLSTIGDMFSFLQLKLEEKFSYDSALINLVNYQLGQGSNGKWSNTQIINYHSKEISSDQKSLIVKIAVIPIFLNDYTDETQKTIEVNCILNPKINPDMIEPLVLNNIKQYFQRTHSFETEIFPTVEEWNNLRILDLYYLLEQSLALSLYYENFDKIDFRFIYESGNNDFLYRMNYLLSKSCFLPSIKQNKDILFPIKIYFDGVVCYECNLIVGGIIFTKSIDWEKKWQEPLIWKDQVEL